MLQFGYAGIEREVNYSESLFQLFLFITTSFKVCSLLQQ
jgi:hypothetical protein